LDSLNWTILLDEFYTIGFVSHVLTINYSMETVLISIQAPQDIASG